MEPLLYDEVQERRCEGEVYRSDDGTTWACSYRPHDNAFACDYSIQVFKDEDAKAS